MENCIFCKIIKGEVPAKVEYSDNNIIVLQDINPQAPVHLLVLPKKHIENILDITTEDNTLLGEIFKAIREFAKKKEIDQSGFRVVVNCKSDGGQSVPHLHFHLLGKRQMAWPPG